MQSYDSIKKTFGHLPPTQVTRIIYRHFNAISSEAYLLQTKGNILTDIFNLLRKIEHAKSEKKGMNDEFDSLTDKLEDVSRRVLDFTSNEDEARYLVAGDEVNTTSDVASCRRHYTIPPAIRSALLLDVKGVIIQCC